MIAKKKVFMLKARKGTRELKNGNCHVSTQKMHGFNFNLNETHLQSSLEVKFGHGNCPNFKLFYCQIRVGKSKQGEKLGSQERKGKSGSLEKLLEIFVMFFWH